MMMMMAVVMVRPPPRGGRAGVGRPPNLLRGAAQGARPQAPEAPPRTARWRSPRVRGAIPAQAPDSSRVLPLRVRVRAPLLRGVVLHASLATLADGVLGEVPRKAEAHGGLDLPRGYGVLLIHAAQLLRLLSKSLKGVCHAGLHDTHRLLGHPHLRVHLLEDLVDVVRVVRGLRRLFLLSLLLHVRHLGRWNGHLCFLLLQ